MKQDTDKLRADLEAWRSERISPKSLTPKELRNRVGLLANKIGVSKTCKLLELSTSSVSRWRSELDGTQSKPVSFAQLDIAEPISVGMATGAMSVDLARTDGMKLSVSGISASDFKQLVSQFLRGESQ